MTRNLKALGLALIAVFAMSALAAGSASAAEFHSEAESTKISASQTNTQVFKSTAGEVTCGKANFTGTTTKKATSSITVAPTYSECHIIVFGSTISAEVKMNGCEYTLNSNKTAAVKCPEGKSIEIVASGCTVKVGAQENLGNVTFENKTVSSPTTHNIVIVIEITLIFYSHSGFTCGTGSGSNGSMTGGALAGGTTTAGATTNIWYE